MRSRARSERRRAKWLVWVVMPTVCLLYVLMFSYRYGLGWAVAWLMALFGSWLPVLIIKPVTWQTWTRRHVKAAFAYYVFLVTPLVFGVVALLFGIWLSPWWCLAIAFGACVLVVAGIWPAQLRYYQRLSQQRGGRPPS